MSDAVTYLARDHFLPFHARTKRWAVLVTHRRAGKTHACLMDMVLRALEYGRTKDKMQPDGRYAYIAPLRNQAKNVSWDLLKSFARPFQASPPNEAELRVDLVGGSRITLFGADNVDSLRGVGLNGCVLDEYADMAPSLWGSVIRPMLADRAGFAVFVGTVRGRQNLSVTIRPGTRSSYALLRPIS